MNTAKKTYAYLEARRQDKVCILYFYIDRCHHCPPCALLVDELEQRYCEYVTFLRISLDEGCDDPELIQFCTEANLLSILQGIPRFFFYNGTTLTLLDPSQTNKYFTLVDRYRVSLQSLMDNIMTGIELQRAEVTLLLQLHRTNDSYFHILPRDLLGLLQCCLSQQNIAPNKLRQFFHDI